MILFFILFLFLLLFLFFFHLLVIIGLPGTVGHQASNKLKRITG